MALVIGYGNPLRADDSVGWQVAQRIVASVADDAEVMSTHQLTPELAEPISQARLVVFVDARVDGEPGTIDCQIVAPAAGESATFSHDLAPAALLALAHLIYGASPPASIVSIAGADFGYGRRLSPTVRAAIPKAVHLVRALLLDGVSAAEHANTARHAGSGEGQHA
jgi:hydrogenase maturation protease